MLYFAAKLNSLSVKNAAYSVSSTPFCSGKVYAILLKHSLFFLSLQKHDLQKFSRNTFTIIAENNYNFLKYNFCCKNDSSDCFTLYSIYMEPTCCLKLRMQGSKTCPQTEETGERLNTSNR